MVHEGSLFVLADARAKVVFEGSFQGKGVCAELSAQLVDGERRLVVKG